MTVESENFDTISTGRNGGTIQQKRNVDETLNADLKINLRVHDGLPLQASQT